MHVEATSCKEQNILKEDTYDDEDDGQLLFKRSKHSSSQLSLTKKPTEKPV